MTENRRRILNMLAEGKIAVDEAERLLSLVSPEGESAGSSQQTEKAVPRPSICGCAWSLMKGPVKTMPSG